MAELADQASDMPASRDVPPAPEPGDPAHSDQQEAAASAADASLSEVLNAMRLAEEAVSSAVQGMADVSQPSTDNNHK